ncbi:MAG: MBL fold metallo-hydrolase [Synergistaceae bacterium]|nr:MBL fold metallo-hydrolase [Synergistaceae bacterium]
MELIQLGENSWYIPGRVNVGYYEESGKGYLIDTGLDDDYGRKLLRAIEGRKVPLEAIINTHSNADHIGGNSFIQKRTGCKVWATRLETLITESPKIEPMFLWGAYPFSDIRNKFIEAKPSKAEAIPNEGRIMDTALTAVPLPGHFLDMIGVLTPDNVFYIADALFDPAVISKYFFMVMLDITSAYRTFDLIEKFGARWFVPCHAKPAEDIKTLVDENRNALRVLSEEVLAACAEARSREEILAELAGRHGIEMDASHFLLNQSSVAAHLTWLCENGLAEHFMEGSRLLWRRKGKIEDII